MQAVIGNDALNAALADREVRLAKFLGDDLGGGLGIQETVAQDLAHRLAGAAVVGFGAGLLGLESQQAAGLEGAQDLVIALAAIAVLLGECDDIAVQALTFEEHEEAPGEFVARRDGQGTGGAGDLVIFRTELEGCSHGDKVAGRWLSV